MPRYTQRPQQGVGIAYTPHDEPGFFENAGNMLQQAQQQYDMTTAAQAESMAQYGQEFSFDPELRDEMIGKYKESLSSIVEDYGGDVGAARNKIVRRMGEEATNPFWQANRYQVEQAKRFQNLIDQFGPDAIIRRDPRSAGVLRQALSSGDIGVLDADVVKASDYAIAADRLGKDLQAKLRDMGITEASHPTFGKFIRTGNIAELTRDQIATLARDEQVIEAFKRIAPTHAYDNREGFTDLQSDEGISRFLEGLWAQKETRQEKFSYQQYQEPKTSGGGGDLTGRMGPRSKFTGRGNAVSQGVLPEVNNVSDLNEAASNPDHLQHGLAREMREDFRNQVFESGRVPDLTESLEDIATKTLPKTLVFNKLNDEQKSQMVERLMDFEESYSGEAVKEYLGQVLQDIAPEVLEDIYRSKARTHRGIGVIDRATVAVDLFGKAGASYDYWNKRVDDEVDRLVTLNKTETNQMSANKEAREHTAEIVFRQLSGLGEGYGGRVQRVGKNGKLEELDTKASNEIALFTNNPNKFNTVITQATATSPPIIDLVNIESGEATKVQIQGSADQIVTDWLQLAMETNEPALYHGAVTYAINKAVGSRFNADNELKAIQALENNENPSRYGALRLATIIPDATHPDLLNLYVVRTGDKIFEIMGYEDGEFKQVGIEGYGDGETLKSDRNQVGELIDVLMFNSGIHYNNPSFMAQSAHYNAQKYQTNTNKRDYFMGVHNAFLPQQ